MVILFGGSLLFSVFDDYWRIIFVCVFLLHAVAAHLTGIHSAIKMLNSRIRVLHHSLVGMQKGICPFLLNVVQIKFIWNACEYLKGCLTFL